MHHPRKRFGQHFLHDPNVIARIVAVINPQPGQRLLEIGPGQGVLTAPLLQQLGTLHAIEIDRDLSAALRLRFPHGLILHQGDVLDFDFGPLIQDMCPLRLVGNLPYNISTPLLFHIFQWVTHISDMVFMLQKEVVERLAAAPDTKAYGRLSVMAQYYCTSVSLFDVGPGAFTPPPQVDSAVVALYPHTTRPNIAPDVFAHIVQHAFSMRRKTLRNNLKGILNDADFEYADIAPQRRAETLELDEFTRLAHAFVAKKSGHVTARPL
jgi:16S rRNA (adenine1518-N6/adenine1519-N6)-dimethyltransferase